MNRTHGQKSRLATVLGLLVIGVAPTPASAQETVSLAIVVHAASPLDSITTSELKAVFLGKQKYWADGSRIVPINLASSHPTRIAFDAKVLGMSSTQAGRYWVKQKIQGRAVPPKSVPQPLIAAKMVSKIKGAISYVPLADVPAGVKVLEVAGRAAGAAGYPLQMGE